MKAFIKLKLNGYTSGLYAANTALSHHYCRLSFDFVFFLFFICLTDSLPYREVGKKENGDNYKNVLTLHRL